MSFKDQALALHEKGLNVLPIWPNGVNGSNGKDKPVFPWAVWQKQKQSRKEVEEWIEKYPECNIAVITGDINSLLVLDFDNAESCADFCMEHDMPGTRIAKTAKGYHYYFRIAPHESVSSYVAVLPHVDIRCNGGYVIAPDSVHASGFVYHWDNELAIADCPDFVMALVENRKKKPEHAEPKQDKWVEELLKGVGEGKRNDACARLAGFYIGKGLNQWDTLSLLKAWNRNNTPPMAEGEIKTTIASIYQKEEKAEPEQVCQAEPVTISQCKRTISKWIYYKDDNIIDIALAVAISTPTDQDPNWMVLVGAASTGKTELLRAFESHPFTYYLDKVTPPAFATGFKQTKGLLERVNGQKRLLVIQDLSTFFSKSQQECAELFDILRQIYNGKYYNEWGSGKKVLWQGKFNFLSASTPEIETRSVGDLGERFLYYRIDSNDEVTRLEMKSRARAAHGKELAARKEIKDAIHGVMEFCKGKDITSVVIPDDIYTAIENLVDAITSLRSPVKRNSYRQDQIEYEPVQEGPARMMKMLMNLAQSLAVVRGRDVVNEEDMNVIRKIGMDSLPSMRRRVLRSLLRNKERGFLKAKDLAEDCGYISSAACTYRLEDLSSLGACIKKYERKVPDSFGRADLNHNAPSTFMLNPTFFEMLSRAGVLELLGVDGSVYNVEPEAKGAITVVV